MIPEISTPIDSVEVADSQAVLEHLLHKTPLDPEVYRRVRERAARVTNELKKKYGTVDIAVQFVREAREE